MLYKIIRYYETKKEQRKNRCSFLLLLYYKARNTVDENIFRLRDIQALTILVEVVRVELTSYSAAKKLSTYLVYLFFLKTATRINTLYVSQEAE